MKKSILITGGLLLLLLIFAPALHAGRQVRVGVYQNEPKLFVDSQGKAQGIFIEIIEYIAAKEDWNIQYVPGTWEQGLRRLEDGQIDLMADIAYSEERDSIYDYHDETILTNWAQVYVPEGSNIESILDLEGKNVAVLKGDISYSGLKSTLKQFGIKCHFAEVNEFIHVFELVHSRIVDAGLISRLFGLEHEKEFEVKKSPIICCPMELFYATARGQNGDLLEAIDRHLMILKEDQQSAYYRSINRWLGPEIGVAQEIPKWVWWILVAVAALGVIFFIHHRILHARVRSMTAEIRKKNEALVDEIAVRMRTEEKLKAYQQHLEEMVEERTGELRASEEKYRLLADNVSDTIWTLDREENFTYLSPSVERLAGYTQEEAAHLTLSGLLTPASLETSRQRIGQRVAEGNLEETLLFELELVRKDGSTFWAEVSSTPTTDEGGNITGFLGVTRDISKRREAEKALRESEERYRSIVENATLGIFRTTPEGRVLTANPALAEIMGYDSPQEIIDTIEDLAQQVYEDPEDRKRVLKMMQEKGKAITELNFRRKDGQKIIAGINMWMVPDEEGNLRFIEGFLQDITEKKEMEEKLMIHHRIFTATSDGITVTDPKGKLLDFNPAMLQQIGYSADELRGKDMTAFVVKEDAEKIGPTLEKTGTFRGEAKIQHKDGSLTYADLSIFPIMHERGNVTCYVGMGRDITERKEAEEALRRERDKAQRYLDIAGVMIVAIDADQKVSLVNRRGVEILGYAEEEITGKNWFNNHIPKNLRKGVKAAFEKLMAGEIEPVEYYENPIQTQDGEERLIAWHNTVLRDEEDNIIGTLSSGEDITEQKIAAEALRESEEKFRVMSSAAHDAIAMIDNDGDVTYWNKAAEKIFGHSSGEMKGKNLHDILMPSRYQQAYQKGFQTFRTTGKGAAVGKILELEGLKKDGTEVSVELSMSSVKLKGRWNAIGIMRDITERKQAEEAIRQANVKLQKAFDELKSTQSQLVQTEKMASMGRLVAGVAHEFNNPIGAVMSSSNNLKSGLVKFDAICNETKEDICEFRPQMQTVLTAMKNSQQVIDEGSQRVAKIVRRLRAFARLDEAELQLADIHQSIEEALQLLPPGWDKHITLVRSYGQLPKFTYFPSRINQALNNVFVNAVEAIKGKGTIQIATRTGDKSAVIVIQDSGVGMSSDVREHIFDPGITTKSRGVGTGLGMAISFQIVRDHRGNIQVESQEGKGTTVTLTLPLNLERRGRAKS